MKLRFKGGNKEKVSSTDPKTKKAVTVEKEQLTQMFEETEYHWPKPGSVLSVPANVGSWLLYKCGKHLEDVVDDTEETSSAPRRLVAVVPEETKPAADAK